MILALNRLNKILSLSRTLLISPVKLYRYALSPLFPPSCRFTPTCSEYFIEAVMKYGCIKGSFLGIKRLFKCHPLHKGGYDPLQ